MTSVPEVCTLIITDVEDEWLTFVQHGVTQHPVCRCTTPGAAIDAGISWAKERGLYVLVPRAMSVLNVNVQAGQLTA